MTAVSSPPASSAYAPEHGRLLVVAKAPVPGRVKTRLAATVGDRDAATLAAAALLDTLTACSAAVGPHRCHLALAGDLADGVAEDEIRSALHGWSVAEQRGDGLGERLAHAHAALAPRPVLQIGMDTPQVTPELLGAAMAGLTTYDAVLGPAADGGWWALALRDPRHAAALVDVPMSHPSTGEATHAALARRGLRVGAAPRLRDVDHHADAVAVAESAPTTRFARAWAAVVGSDAGRASATVPGRTASGGPAR